MRVSGLRRTMSPIIEPTHRAGTAAPGPKAISVAKANAVEVRSSPSWPRRTTLIGSSSPTITQPKSTQNSSGACATTSAVSLSMTQLRLAIPRRITAVR